jgi:hypothetical protein
MSGGNEVPISDDLVAYCEQIPSASAASSASARSPRRCARSSPQIPADLNARRAD